MQSYNFLGVVIPDVEGLLKVITAPSITTTSSQGVTNVIVAVMSVGVGHAIGVGGVGGVSTGHGVQQVIGGHVLQSAGSYIARKSSNSFLIIHFCKSSPQHVVIP